MELLSECECGFNGNGVFYFQHKEQHKEQSYKANSPKAKKMSERVSEGDLSKKRLQSANSDVFPQPESSLVCFLT